MKRRIDGLKGIQVEHSKIESEFQMAILELEKKVSCLAWLCRTACFVYGLYRNFVCADHFPQFLSKYSPLYDRRLAIIQGKEEPTEVEIEAGQNADSDDEEDDEEAHGARITEVKDDKPEGEDEKVNGVPEFWLTALRNHAPISDTITDRDEEVGWENVQKATLDVLLGPKTFDRYSPFLS